MNGDIGARLRALAVELVGRLPAEDVCDVFVLLERGECVVAFDKVCTGLYEHAVVLSRPQYLDIERTGRMMDLSPALWTYLRDQLL